MKRKATEGASCPATPCTWHRTPRRVRPAATRNPRPVPRDGIALPDGPERCPRDRIIMWADIATSRDVASMVSAWRVDTPVDPPSAPLQVHVCLVAGSEHEMGVRSRESEAANPHHRTVREYGASVRGTRAGSGSEAERIEVEMRESGSCRDKMPQKRDHDTCCKFQTVNVGLHGAHHDTAGRGRRVPQPVDRPR